MKSEIYDVLARKNAGEPLQIIGAVTAPTEGLAVVYASKTYDEFHYSDMRIVPRKAFIHVYSKSSLIGK